MLYGRYVFEYIFILENLNKNIPTIDQIQFLVCMILTWRFSTIINTKSLVTYHKNTEYNVKVPGAQHMENKLQKITKGHKGGIWII